MTVPALPDRILRQGRALVRAIEAWYQKPLLSHKAGQFEGVGHLT